MIYVYIINVILFLVLILAIIHVKNLPSSGLYHCKQLLDIITIQNDTISLLESFIRKNKSLSVDVMSLKSANIEVDNSLNTLSFRPNQNNNNIVMKCQNQFGSHLLNDWKSSEELWCESLQSSLRCYPYEQEHKKQQGSGSDNFCVAENFVIDFSKIHGSVPSEKPPLGQQYLSFTEGSIVSDCRPTSKYAYSKFMPHHKLQMSSFVGSSSINYNDMMKVDNPIYFLTRDEDCENSFHSTADFMNMYLVLSILQQSTDNLQLLLLDRHPDGPYIELMKRAFSPNYPITRADDYKGKMLFSKIIFHLESPAALIFPKVTRPDPLRCYSTDLFQSYRRFILQAFDLLDVNPPDIPSITLSVRNRTLKKNVGRVTANEKEVVDVLKTGNLVKYQVIDGGSISFADHIKIIRETNILIGVHGAGLMMIMFAAEEAILIEVHPSYRQDRHFRHAARMTGKIYMPIRSHVRETCHGSSDNVIVPIDEFKMTIDGAVRIARSFDDGISECGLVCPFELLALDQKLMTQYRFEKKVSHSINTRFPCD